MRHKFPKPNARRQDARARSKLLEALTADFAEQLQREFAHEITSDPKAFKTYLIRLLRRTLPPKRGRPNDPRIDAAMQMIEQGRTIKDVLRSQITHFEKLDAYGRYLAEKGLRGAIARRRRRSTARNPLSSAVPEQDNWPKFHSATSVGLTRTFR